jgi:hypothetical protein
VLLGDLPVTISPKAPKGSGSDGTVNQVENEVEKGGERGLRDKQI